MKEKLISWMNSRNANSHLMRMLVGGYIAYMAVKIIFGGTASTIQLVFALVLGIPGAILAAVSLYAAFHVYDKEYKEKNAPNRKERSEEE